MDSGHRAVTEDCAFQIYNSSLEEEFNHFEDWLNVFALYRGHGGQDGDREEEGSGHLVGKFKVCLGKEGREDQGAQVETREDYLTRALSVLPQLQGSFLIYPESEAGSFSEPQISRGIPQNRPIKLLVRVYVIKVSVPPTSAKVMYVKPID